MKRTIRNVAVFAALVAVTVCFMHVAIHEPVVWVYVGVFAGITALCGALTVRQELHKMKLPEIAKLDLRPRKEAEIVQLSGHRRRERGRARAATLEPFPSGATASS